MNYSFKKFKISDVEKKWLQEIEKAEFSEIELNKLKIKFREELKRGFDPKRIDHILTQDGRLTLLGYWHIDNNHIIIKQISRSIEIIRDLIINEELNGVISASKISEELDTDPGRGEMILRLIYELGGFFQIGAGAERTDHGMKEAGFRNDRENAYDKFLTFQNIEEKLEDFFLRRSNKRFQKNPVWPKVNRQISSAKELLSQARSAEDFQSVGLCCREALISLAQEVYDEELHGSIDGKKPSEADSKRMLNAYISKVLSGSSDKVYRKLVKSAHDVANATQHKRTADYLHASLCVEATTSVVEVIMILDQGRDRDQNWSNDYSSS